MTRKRQFGYAIIVAALMAASLVIGYIGGRESIATKSSSEGLCSPLSTSTSPGELIPAGVRVTVAYSSNWSLSISRFVSSTINPNYYLGSCNYYGKGTVTFWVEPISTVVVFAHKYDSLGVLVVNATVAGMVSSNSTTRPYGDARIVLSCDSACGEP